MTVTHQMLVDYFKGLTASSIHLQSFFRMDLTEIQGAFRSTARLKCLVLESHEGNFGDSTIQESVNDRTLAFTIYDRPLNGDYEDQDAKLSECEAIGLKVLARMRKDARNKTHFLYNRFLVENVTYAKVGPIFNERLYGYRFVIVISGSEPLVVDPADWGDIEEVCV